MLLLEELLWHQSICEINRQARHQPQKQDSLKRFRNPKIIETLVNVPGTVRQTFMQKVPPPAKQAPVNSPENEVGGRGERERSLKNPNPFIYSPNA